MNKIIAFIFLLLLVSSCVEKIIKEPENLISKDKMTAIFYDLAIVTAAKNTNNEILEKNNIEAMNYIYTKHGIDSLQFIESDLEKRKMDSIAKMNTQKKRDSIKTN